MSVTIPALLFPAISLLFIAYTTRFLGIANVARAMLREQTEHPEAHREVQLVNLRHRLRLIRRMQLLGIVSFILAACSMGAAVNDFPVLAQGVFVASLVSCVGSLGLSVHEVTLSIDALEVEFDRARVPRR